MLKHTQIRQRIIDILSTDLTDFTLYNARRTIIGDELPALSVYSDLEKGENTKDEGDSQRVLDVFIIFKDKHAEDAQLNVLLDTHREIIDNLLTKQTKNLRLETNPGLVQRFWYAGSDQPSFETAASAIHGTVTMHFKALYYKEL